MSCRGCFQPGQLALEVVEVTEQVDALTCDVAGDLGMTANDVYLAKHRCLARLREIVAQLDELYELK